MSDTRITRILLGIASEETKIGDAHLRKADFIRALAAEIELPDQQQKPSNNPKPTPKPSDKTEAKPDVWDDVEDELGKAVVEWLKKLQDITAHPTSWPF